MKLALPLALRTRILTGLAAPEVSPTDEFSVAARAREAAMTALDRGETHYTDRPGLAQLREAVAERLRRLHGLATQAGDVVITCGVTEARFVALQRLLPPRTGTVVALGGGDLLAGASVIRGLELVGPASEPDGSDVVVYFPSGIEPRLVETWLERARVQSWRVIHELGSLAGDLETSRRLASMPNLVYTVGDLAGPYGAAAWRVGFLAAPAKEVGPLREFKQALTLCTTNVSQWGALALVEEDA